MLAASANGVAGAAARGQGVLRGQRHGRLRLWPFLGPAFIACVAYIDPGNFATNVAGGSKFGYTLLWVIVASNLMAMLIQTLSAKLAMATDLAEFLGAALGFHLLLGIGLFPAALITGATAFAILGLQRFGFRPFEATIAAIVGFIGVCYLGEIFKAKPPLGTVAHHAVVPQFAGGESVLLAVGILGATVMPHVIYLHSALLQNRIRPESDDQARTLMRYTRVDVIIAMSIAGLINMAMLVMAASVFFKSGLVHVESLENAHKTLRPILGGGSSTPFALALLVLFTSRRDVMGVLANHRATTLAAIAVAALISGLNVFLLVQTFT